jgi:hypothetical protein
MKYTIELIDENGKSGKLQLSLPLLADDTLDNSTWRVLDEGVFRYRSGGCMQQANKESGIWIGNSSFFGRSDLFLFIGKSPWAVLREFYDVKGFVNSSGEGWLGMKEAVISFKPDADFAWTLLD